jgi:hypothetical protein
VKKVNGEKTMIDYYSSDYGLYSSACGAIWGIYFVLAIIGIVSMWKIFTKAGLAGWKSIVPLYNMYCLFKITWGNGWIFLSMIVPVLDLVIWIMTMYRLAKAFNKGIGFCLGLIFFGVVFYPILAFGNSKYDASIVEK